MPASSEQTDEHFRHCCRNDFNLTIETVDGTKRQFTWATRWVASWRQEREDGEVNDRRFYYLVHTPIKFSPIKRFRRMKRFPSEKGETENLLHVRFKAPDKIHYEGDRPNWWIALETGKPSVAAKTAQAV